MTDKPWPVLCLAIACLTIIEVYALYQHVNGVMMAAVVMGIAGIAGFKARDIIDLIKHK